MRKITKIVIHCSDTPDHRTDIDAEDIKTWHLNNGWTDIGYHYVITRNGTLENGRDESICGSHVRGHNSDSIGICLVGRTVFDIKQLETLLALITGLMYKYNLDYTDIYGHYEFDSSKTCPNIDMNVFRQSLLDYLGM